MSATCNAAVQSHVVGVYALHSALGGCGAPQLLAQLDDAISDTMRECAVIVLLLRWRACVCTCFPAPKQQRSMNNAGKRAHHFSVVGASAVC